MKPFGMERLSNLFVLVALSVGGANLLFYYQVEFAARLYCPKQVSPWLIIFTINYSIVYNTLYFLQLDLQNFFLPRMFECYSQFKSNHTHVN